MLASNSSTAPPKVREVPVLPKDASAFIWRVPPLIVVPPEYVFVFVKAKVPGPSLIKGLLPDTNPLNVATTPLSVIIVPLELSMTLRVEVAVPYVERSSRVPPFKVTSAREFPKELS